MTCWYKWLGEVGAYKSEASSNMTVSEHLCFTLVSSHGPSMCAEYSLCDMVMCSPRMISRKVS